MKKPLLLTAGAVAISALALAHEFWLQPSQFFAAVGQSIQIQTLVGESFTGERSEGKKNRIVFYKHLTASTEADLSPALMGDNYGDVSVKLTTSGTHLFAFTNTPKFIELAPDKFLEYLKEDGLANVIALREQRGETQKPGRELYRRSVKSLVQVGDKPDNTFSRATNLPLDITPTKNPYSQKPGDRADFLIRFENQPLAGVIVRYWNKPNAATKPADVHEEQQTTDALGRVTFRLRAGQNMVSTVRMIPNQNTAEADWQSYWGSLTFGTK